LFLGRQDAAAFLFNIPVQGLLKGNQESVNIEIKIDRLEDSAHSQKK